MSCNTRLIIPKILIALFLLAFDISFAGDSSAYFIDLDGDGFNDSPPAVIEQVGPISSTNNAESNKFISFDLDENNYAATSPSCSARFESFKFGARALDRNRCSFDSDNFGPESAVGITGLSNAGGVCSGGTCHR